MHAPAALRSWSVAGRFTSLQMPGQGMVKSLQRFGCEHTETPERFQELLRECAFYGCPRPSSYSSVFHAQYRSPMVRRTLQHAFAPWFTGGWQEARQVGNLPGRWRQYDLNSAYLWAVTAGLPDTKALRVSDNFGHLPGMYALELTRAVETLPYPFNVTKWVNATTEEINLYALPVARILDGVTWNGSIDAQPIIDTVKQFTFAKEVARSFWGRWCSTVPVECRTASGKHWPLRNPIQNFVWAHIVISRVKARVWQEGRNAAHVFVDSMITTDELATGDGLGEWRQQKEYDGLRVKHAGFYGSLDTWDKTSGAPRAALSRAL